MSYRSLLVHVDSGPTAAARVRLAADLALRFDAYLIGLAAALPRPVVEVYGAGMVGADVADFGREEVVGELKAAEAIFTETLGTSTVKREWRAFYDFPAQALADAATGVDLVVVGQEPTFLHRDVYRTVVVGDLLMEAGRPIIVAPQNVSGIDPKSVLIAWKNRREARLAMSDALPLLHRAKDIHLIQIGEDDGGRESLDAAKAFLSKHGLAARADVKTRAEPSVEEDVLAAAKADGSDLIVAGGYGHSRMREWVLGGVTRTLLMKSPVAALVSH